MQIKSEEVKRAQQTEETLARTLLSPQFVFCGFFFFFFFSLWWEDRDCDSMVSTACDFVFHQESSMDRSEIREQRHE